MPANKLYIGNLPWDATQDLIDDMFNLGCKAVRRVQMATDRETGEFRGFAFVTMLDDHHAAIAINLFNGFTLGTRAMRVSVAVEKARPS